MGYKQFDNGESGASIRAKLNEALLNVPTTYDSNVNYPVNAVVIKDGFVYRANGPVTAGTPFTEGNIGDTFSRVIGYRVRYQGQWFAEYDYAEGDVVIYSAQLYRALTDITGDLNASPPINAIDEWFPLGSTSGRNDIERKLDPIKNAFSGWNKTGIATNSLVEANTGEVEYNLITLDTGSTNATLKSPEFGYYGDFRTLSVELDIRATGNPVVALAIYETRSGQPDKIVAAHAQQLDNGSARRLKTELNTGNGGGTYKIGIVFAGNIDVIGTEAYENETIIRSTATATSASTIEIKNLSVNQYDKGLESTVMYNPALRNESLSVQNQLVKVFGGTVVGKVASAITDPATFDSITITDGTNCSISLPRISYPREHVYEVTFSCRTSVANTTILIDVYNDTGIVQLLSTPHTVLGTDWNTFSLLIPVTSLAVYELRVTLANLINTATLASGETIDITPISVKKITGIQRPLTDVNNATNYRLNAADGGTQKVRFNNQQFGNNPQAFDFTANEYTAPIKGNYIVALNLSYKLRIDEFSSINFIRIKLDNVIVAEAEHKLLEFSTNPEGVCIVGIAYNVQAGQKIYAEIASINEDIVILKETNLNIIYLSDVSHVTEL